MECTAYFHRGRAILRLFARWLGGQPVATAMPPALAVRDIRFRDPTPDEWDGEVQELSLVSVSNDRFDEGEEGHLA